MKKSFLKRYRNEYNPKYNSHLKRNSHSKARGFSHLMAWSLLVLMALVIIAVVVISGTFFLYRDANNEAKQQVVAQVERNNQPQEPVYNQSSLNETSNHATDKKLVKNCDRADQGFVSHMTYDPKRDVANVTLNKPATRDVKYASNVKKATPQKLSKSLKTGVKIDDLLSNQAVEVANQAHDGYFTFKFTNANGYQAPNTKTGNYNE